MARFDLYGNPDDQTRRLAPYLLDVQSTHVGILPTRIVIPLRPTPDLGFSGKPSDLLPVFEINGEKHFLDTPAMSAVPLNALGRRIGSLADHRDAILAALDRIFGAH
ncbi:CcdB family protein [Caballeronia sp. SEWSISQ10-4 2]|uniref:CcdB family protein n=1 Tax=Caballeronia sp. SEWSISQ10-4 2 TaxID=2937438 RepID=UPI00264E8661|nr:CcdB family protein [Caballeronia sp. SEWSISQ10-4 2]MDN7178747.1 CcdB family protein [Caballeronia sp. SEWSISQ10-4 2]